MIEDYELKALVDERYKCEQCGKSDDIAVAFTKYRVCGKCTKKNHRKAVSR